MTKAFCDGFEIHVGKIVKAVTTNDIAALKNFLNMEVTELIFKNIHLQARAMSTYLWITLNPETTFLTPRTLQLIKSTVGKVKQYAESVWLFDRQKLTAIALWKIDVAADYYGALLTADFRGSYSYVKNVLAACLIDVFENGPSNFLSLSRFGDVVVTNGDNNLDSCFQYYVKRARGARLLKVKLYDKLLDLAARDGSNLVGSRLKAALGAKDHLSMFERRVRRAQSTGMTRLEISVLHDALSTYQLLTTPVRTQWHTKI